MPIKNYTTSVPANRSIQEIQDSLIKHGASGFLLKYEQGTGRIARMEFILEIEKNNFPFRMPVEWRLFQQVLKEQRVKHWDNEDYCYRVAWRVLRDWVLTQMALYETKMINIPQAFLAYAVRKDGDTAYEAIIKNPQFLLGDGN